MGSPRSRRWAVAATAVLLALLALDLATGPDVIVIALYGIAPLVASFGTGWRTTAAVAVGWAGVLRRKHANGSIALALRLSRHAKRGRAKLTVRAWVSRTRWRQPTAARASAKAASLGWMRWR